MDKKVRSVVVVRVSAAFARARSRVRVCESAKGKKGREGKRRNEAKVEDL